MITAQDTQARADFAEQLRQLILQKDGNRLKLFLIEHFKELPKDLQLSVAITLISQGLINLAGKDLEEYRLKANILGDVEEHIKEYLEKSGNQADKSGSG
jgi:hypothetical protein